MNLLRKLLHSMGLALMLASFFLASCETSKEKAPALASTKAPSKMNLAYLWAGIALECTAMDTELHAPRPTISSRMLALVQTSVYDAWTGFDATARPLYLRQSYSGIQSDSAKEVAISYAAYRSLTAFFPDCRSTLDAFMDSLQLPLDDYGLDPSSPAGIGNLAALSVLQARRNDGSNQHDSPSYSDYTGYQPVNTPEERFDALRWQPKTFLTENGERHAPPCLTPHWQLVAPFALDSASQFRAPEPPELDSPELRDQVREVIDLQANMKPEERALVEFMRDGPKSVQQAGHWMIFARHVSQRDKHDLDTDVAMYFLVQNAAMDAFIACWDSKMHYDYARPMALVHTLFPEDSLTGWKGKNQGWRRIHAQEWQAYSPASFLCPPFPAYVSGHSTVSAACAEVLRLFKGEERFDLSVEWTPGILTDPDSCDAPVTLHFPTFTETAEMAGRSRVIGGYHIEADNREGLIMGRKVAHQVYEKYQQLRGEKAITTR